MEDKPMIDILYDQLTQKLKEEIEDYKSLLRLVYKQPISQEMVAKVLKKWEEK